jgi:hypothetical protein
MYLNETYSKVHDMFPTKNVAASRVSSEYDVRKLQENEVRLKLNGRHLLLFCADDINLLQDINSSSPPFVL